MTEYLSALASLLFVLGLLGLLAWAVKRFALLPGQIRTKPGEKQLTVLESKTLDARNRLVIVSWRGKQFLLGSNPAGIRLLASEDENANDEFKKMVRDNEKS